MTQVNDTFQAVISTDGEVTFAAFIYKEPLSLFSTIHDVPQSLAIGFDKEKQFSGDFGNFLVNNNRTLEAVHIFRIDGTAAN